MNPSSLPLLAESLPSLLYVLAIPSIFSLMVICILSHFRSKEEQRRHETARLALEKGQPIPSFAQPLASSSACGSQQKNWMGLMIGGLVNIAVGTGLYFMLASMPGASVARFCGLIPGLVGVALLLAALIVGMASRTNSDLGGPPPMS